MLNKSALMALAVMTTAAFASAAQAGGPQLTTLSGSPNPSTAGTPVTITATFSYAGTCSVAVVDQTNSDAPLCTINTAGSSTGTCAANFASGGVRIVRGIASGPSGCYDIRSYVQTVNAVATAVPTVSEWTMWGLAGLIALGGGVALARRSRRYV
ncbi:hypothetical protein [Brevundimonas sp. DC300-4]|uniref:hypothetical protein n=1 Tax=Brevundimonas sp. DC300-4 TaxID=2804594 RepID=UPI003CE9FF4D